MSKPIRALLLVSLLASTAHAEDAPLPPPPQKTLETFELDGQAAFLYAAPNPAPGKPWLWYMPTFKGLALVGKKAYYDSFLGGGVAIAGYNLGEVRGAPASTAKFLLFYEEMVKRGYSKKPIVLGQSRGGLQMFGWAMRHPDKTGALVGIYPICSLAVTGMKNLQATLPDYQLSEEELRKRMAEFDPLDNLKPMIDARLPIFIVQGDIDKAVPLASNVAPLKQRYEAGGGPITVKIIAGEGHAGSPSFYACPELIEFVIKQAGGRPMPMPTTRPATVPVDDLPPNTPQ